MDEDSGYFSINCPVSLGATDTIRSKYDFEIGQLDMVFTFIIIEAIMRFIFQLNFVKIWNVSNSQSNYAE